MENALNICHNVQVILNFNNQVDIYFCMQFSALFINWFITFFSGFIILPWLFLGRNRKQRKRERKKKKRQKMNQIRQFIAFPMTTLKTDFKVLLRQFPIFLIFFAFHDQKLHFVPVRVYFTNLMISKFYFTFFYESNIHYNKRMHS